MLVACSKNKLQKKKKNTEIENKIPILSGFSTKTKHLLIENKLKKLQTFDSICFRGKSHFEEDAT